MILTTIMAHVFGDYFLQTDYLAGNKGKDNYILLIHCFLYGLGGVRCLSNVGLCAINR